ncbi:hypothetical protein NADE_005679 [Nannochloris sp. 'desiccata']|nr:hypothetical protein NADE_005679 [Chlorella desiccata (nom. nud.)]
MVHSAGAAVRQRTISSSFQNRIVEHPSTSHVCNKSPLRVKYRTPSLGVTHVGSNASHRLPHKRFLIPSAQGGNGGTPPPSPEENDPKRRELNLLLSLIVQYPAVRGSIAVALGYWAHIDPWGTFRFDSEAIAIGCALAIVPSLMDMIILLPNWEPERTTRTMKLKMPRDVAEKLQVGGSIKILDTRTGTTAALAPTAANENEQSADDNATTSTIASTTESLLNAVISLDTESSMAVDTDTKTVTSTLTNGAERNPQEQPPPPPPPQPLFPDMVDVERKMTVRVDQHPLRDALQSLQMSRVVSNIGRSLSPPSEALLLFLVHVSEEMLYRGVILVLAVRWCTDNLYYAGVEESVVLPGTGLELAPPQLGAILGGIGLTVGAVGLLVQKELFPLRLLDATKEQLQNFVEDRKKGNSSAATGGDKNGKERVEDATKLEKKKKVVAGLLERLRSGVVIQQRWIVAVEATVEFLQWSTLSTSFLLTGNILAPIAGSMVNDVIYSACQRVKNREIKEAMKERANSASERAKQTADLLTAVREHRKSRLEPPKGSSNALGKKQESSEEVSEEKEDSKNTDM